MPAPSSTRPVPSAFITQTWVSSMVVSDEVESRRVPANASLVPSGDHTGVYSALRLLVSRRTRRVRAETVNTS